MKYLNVRIMTAFRSFTHIREKLKAVIVFLILFMAFNAVTWIAPQKASAQEHISFQVFYDNLSPYGNWVDNSDYGYVWVPRVPHGFIPYGTNGHWIFTHAGWTWVSNYSWGWAPFHYGRWFYDPYYGWVWVPDNEWGPGWVVWRRSQGYYGWAPIAPGISIDIAYSNSYNLPYNRWRFVRERDFGRTNIYNYYVSSSNYTTIIKKSTVINNFQIDNSRNVRYNAGPDRTEVEKRAGKRFTPVAIKEIDRPGQNMGKEELRLYRPQVQKNIAAERKPAPSKVGGWKGNQVKKQQPVQQQRNNQPAKQQPPVQQQRNNQPAKQQQPVQQQRNNQPAKQQQPVQQQRKVQPARQQQPVQQQRNNQPAKQQQPVQQQRNNQPAKQQQPVQQQRNNQPAKQQQPVQQQRKDQPARQQQPVQQQRKDQPAKQPPQVQQQQRDQPAKEQPPVQQQQKDQPAKQPPAEQ